MARMTLQQQLSNAEAKMEDFRTSIGLLQAERAQLIEQNNNLLKTVENQQKEIFKLRASAEELEKVKKELESVKGMKQHYEASSNSATNELEQCHAVLDGVEGAPSRTYEGKYGDNHRTVVTRLAGAFLSIAKNGGAK